MNIRLRITLAVVVLALVCLAVLSLLFPREPVHEGRRLSAWLRDLTALGAGNTDPSQPARKAVREIGTNALPFLIKMLQTQDPQWKSGAVTWLEDKCDIDLSSALAERQQQRAINGFHVLGRAAEPAIPALRSLALGSDSALALRAMEALRGIGEPHTLPFFLDALNSTNLVIRGEAITSLASFRSRAREAGPVLLKLLESNEPTIRFQVARALGEIAADPDLAVPALADCLSDNAAGIKVAAALALGSFGTNAISALPALRALADDQAEDLRRAGRLAVVRVQCEIRDGAIIRGPKDRRRMALVFTGHEFGEGGETILNDLARRQGRASFFLTGAFLTNSQFTAVAERMQSERHYLGPHSDRHLLYCAWDESRKTLVNEEQFEEDLLANAAKIPSNANESRRFSRYFLPPFEHYNREIADWTRANGWTLINFTPGTCSNADYTGEADKNFVASQKIFESIVARERDDPDGLNGFILLLRLGAGPGRADKFHARFGELLDYLAGRGYEFVRVDELLRPPRDPNPPGGFPRSSNR